MTNQGTEMVPSVCMPHVWGITYRAMTRELGCFFFKGTTQGSISELTEKIACPGLMATGLKRLSHNNCERQCCTLPDESCVCPHEGRSLGNVYCTRSLGSAVWHNLHRRSHGHSAWKTLDEPCTVIGRWLPD